MRVSRGARRLAMACQLPEDALYAGARVVWMGRGSALVEGQRGVVELSNTRIRLRTQDGMLSIMGEALELGELSVDAAMIRARRIDSMTYGPADQCMKR